MSEASRKAWFDARRCVGVWLTHPEYSLLEQSAKAMDQTVSSLSRDILVDTVCRAHVEAHHKHVTPRPQQPEANGGNG